MTLAKFIDTRLKHSDYVTIFSMGNMVLYRGIVADIPYRLAVKSDFISATMAGHVISVCVVYNNN